MVACILITANYEQFGAHVIECMEESSSAQHLACRSRRTVYIMLSEIGQQPVFVVKPICHVKCQIFFIPILVAIRGVGI